MESEDPRCCGGGACIIDARGACWCGQVWDGQKMCMPALVLAGGAAAAAAAAAAASPSRVTGPPADTPPADS